MQETRPGDLPRERRSGQSGVTLNDLIKAALVPSLMGVSAMAGLYWKFEENRAATAQTLTRIEVKVDKVSDQTADLKSKTDVMDWRMQQIEKIK